MLSDGKWWQVIASDVTRCGGYGGQQRKARSTGPPTGNPYKALVPQVDRARGSIDLHSQVETVRTAPTRTRTWLRAPPRSVARHKRRVPWSSQMKRCPCTNFVWPVCRQMVSVRCPIFYSSGTIFGPILTEPCGSNWDAWLKASQGYSTSLSLANCHDAQAARMPRTSPNERNSFSTLRLHEVCSPVSTHPILIP